MAKNMRVLSFNLNGINGPIKRKRTLAYIKKLKIDIAFLQETHLTDKEHSKLKRDWVGTVIAASFNSKSRGVAILIHKKLPIRVLNTEIDVSGRYVIVHCQIYSEFWTLLNVYAPNVDDEKLSKIPL